MTRRTRWTAAAVTAACVAALGVDAAAGSVVSRLMS
jgi:hypothetical protein